MTILKATKDNSKAILTPFEQGAGEGDWRRYQARVKGRGKVLSIDAGQTTSTTLVAGGAEVFEGDQLYLQEGLDATVKPVTAGAGTAGTTSTLDILGDGSCIALYNLDGNTSDISGNYNGTWTGTPTYTAGVYGQAADVSGANKYITSDVTWADCKAISLFVNFVNLTGSQSVVCLGIGVTSMQILLASTVGTAISGTRYMTTLTPVVGQWYHMLVQNNGNDIYIDQVKQTLGATGGWADPTQDKLTLGQITGSPVAPANCFIDQVRCFSRNLTQNEINFLGNETPQIIDISSAGFINVPTRAVLKAPSIDICLEDEARRCISANYNVPITQAFNDTIVTSLPEFNAITRDCLDVGDDIVLTVGGSPVTTEILTIDKSTPNQYTITFAPQATPPTACTVPSRAVAQTNPTPVGDWDGDNMTLEYDAVLKQGRALEISVQGDNTHEISQVNVDLYKEVI